MYALVVPFWLCYLSFFDVIHTTHCANWLSYIHSFIHSFLVSYNVCCCRFKMKCFATSIWDETLYRYETNMILWLSYNVCTDLCCYLCTLTSKFHFQHLMFLLFFVTLSLLLLLIITLGFWWLGHGHKLCIHWFPTLNSWRPSWMILAPSVLRTKSFFSRELLFLSFPTFPNSSTLFSFPTISTLETIDCSNVFSLNNLSSLFAFSYRTLLSSMYAPLMQCSSQHYDTHRFERISNIIKQFKLSCSKTQSQFQGIDMLFVSL